MNPAQIAIVIVMLMIVVACVFLVRFSRVKASSSERRMRDMLRMAGLDPDIVVHGTNEMIIREVRSRCSKCQSEGICDRWLAGKETGNNDFCPNAGVFQMLAEHAGARN